MHRGTHFHGGIRWQRTCASFSVYEASWVVSPPPLGPSPPPPNHPPPQFTLPPKYRRIARFSQMFIIISNFLGDFEPLLREKNRTSREGRNFPSFLEVQRCENLGNLKKHKKKRISVKSNKEAQETSNGQGRDSRRTTNSRSMDCLRRSSPKKV